MEIENMKQILNILNIKKKPLNNLKLKYTLIPTSCLSLKFIPKHSTFNI